MTAETPILASTLLFTVLSLIGLFFFIRSAVKERRSVWQTPLGEDQTPLLDRIKDYLLERGYGLETVKVEEQILIFGGQTGPSPFLALFLSVLALFGAGCLALTLSILWPWFQERPLLLALLTLLSPLAGLFYWQNAQRRQEVTLQLSPPSGSETLSRLTLNGPKDELKQLQATLKTDDR
ncbi:MAG: cofactor assembly of complex C subunit B [Cyanobacteria bacterium RI_101]|nr:cofactor assembly of complex C subunit B [Cyanobacteria bacterium RI_101]